MGAQPQTSDRRHLVFVTFAHPTEDIRRLGDAVASPVEVFHILLLERTVATTVIPHPTAGAAKASPIGSPGLKLLATDFALLPGNHRPPKRDVRRGNYSQMSRYDRSPAAPVGWWRGATRSPHRRPDCRLHDITLLSDEYGRSVTDSGSHNVTLPQTLRFVKCRWLCE
jgi:hypothetical protein